MRILVASLLLLALSSIPAQGVTQLPAPIVWRTVAEWKGGGDKITPPFTIQSQKWRIVWERTVVGYGFDIYVYRPNPNPPKAIDCRDHPHQMVCERQQEDIRNNPWLSDQLVVRGGPGLSITRQNEWTNIIPVRGLGKFYLLISAGFAPYVWTVTVQEPAP